MAAMNASFALLIDGHDTYRPAKARSRVDRPGKALLRARPGFLCGLRALPRGDTWPHAVEMPIRYSREGALVFKRDMLL